MNKSNVFVSKKTPFYIVSYFTKSDKKSMVGGIRPYFLYDMLVEKGWNVYLVTPNYENGNEIVITEGYVLRFLKPLLRLFSPDYTIGWALKVYSFFKKNPSESLFVVFTTVPPNGLGIIGLLVKLFLKNSVWIADYRDLWTMNTLYNPPITKKFIDPILEREFHKKADLVILNTNWDSELNQKKFPFLKGKSTFIRNGFDKVLPNKSYRDMKFVYSGGTYKGMATKKINEFLIELNRLNFAYTCDFYGEYDRFMPNAPFIEYKGTVNFKEVPELLTNYKFGMIYLPEGSESGGRVVQKLYDYIGSGVIPICFNASKEMKEILIDLNIGLPINDETNIQDVLKFINGAKFDVINEKLEKYTRFRQFEGLIERIEITNFN